MSDEITFKETGGDDIFARAIWAALCEDISVFKALGVVAGANNGDKVLTIECKVNGIEISLKGYLERLEKHLDHRVNRIDNMHTMLEKFEKQLLTDFFPNDPDLLNDR